MSATEKKCTLSTVDPDDAIVFTSDLILLSIFFFCSSEQANAIGRSDTSPTNVDSAIDVVFK